jgi:hypothetical protein
LMTIIMPRPSIRARGPEAPKTANQLSLVIFDAR